LFFYNLLRKAQKDACDDDSKEWRGIIFFVARLTAQTQQIREFGLIDCGISKLSFVCWLISCVFDHHRSVLISFNATEMENVRTIVMSDAAESVHSFCEIGLDRKSSITRSRNRFERR
jgi:hypothetical protein